MKAQYRVLNAVNIWQQLTFPFYQRVEAVCTREHAAAFKRPTHNSKSDSVTAKCHDLELHIHVGALEAEAAEPPFNMLLGRPTEPGGFMFIVYVTCYM